MPFHSENRLVDTALGGWIVSGTVYYHTGFPFSLWIQVISSMKLRATTAQTARYWLSPLRRCRNPVPAEGVVLHAV